VLLAAECGVARSLEPDKIERVEAKVCFLLATFR
jgi:hypothetical protein